MLVLSRKPQEKIVIDGNIEVTVLKVAGNRVKLGISCPAEIPVRREELWTDLDQKRVQKGGRASRALAFAS